MPGLGEHEGGLPLPVERAVQRGCVADGAFQATADRFASTPGLVLVVQDTTEFSFRWAKRETIGAITPVPNGLDRNGKPRMLTQCGLLMHGSLVVTREGLPLGLAAVQFWSRKTFKGTNELKRHVNTTRVPIEYKESIRWLSSLTQSTKLLADPGRCVFIGDRENDIYEFFCAVREAGTHFLVRTCVDRLTDDGHRTVARLMARVPVSGQHRIEVPDAKGRPTTATLQLRFRKIHILPPIGKQKRYPALDLTVIHAFEARSRAVGPALNGNSSPTWPSTRCGARSRSSAGVPSAGKSSCSTRS